MCQQGLISYSDFKRVLQESEDELESQQQDGGDGSGAGSASFGSIPPRPIPELVDTSKVCLFHFAVIYHYLV